MIFIWYKCLFIFIRPSSDGTYFGMVMSVRVSIRPSVTVFRTFFLHTLTYWDEILHIIMFYCTTVAQIKFECRRFASNFVGVMPFVKLRILEIQFSALFSYMLRHIELKFCIWLCFYCTADQVRVSTICNNYLEAMPLLKLRILKITQFSALFSYMFLFIELKFCIWPSVYELQIKFGCHDFLFMNFRSSGCHYFRSSLKEVPLWMYNFAHFSWVCFQINLKFLVWHLSISKIL